MSDTNSSSNSGSGSDSRIFASVRNNLATFSASFERIFLQLDQDGQKRGDNAYAFRRAKNVLQKVVSKYISEPLVLAAIPGRVSRSLLTNHHRFEQAQMFSLLGQKLGDAQPQSGSGFSGFQGQDRSDEESMASLYDGAGVVGVEEASASTAVGTLVDGLFQKGLGELLQEGGRQMAAVLLPEPLDGTSGQKRVHVRKTAGTMLSRLLLRGDPRKESQLQQSLTHAYVRNRGEMLFQCGLLLNMETFAEALDYCQHIDLAIQGDNSHRGALGHISLGREENAARSGNKCKQGVNVRDED
jgi:hypothetical protein